MVTALLAALAVGAAAPAPIVIDPGHGGERNGAVGPDGAKEKDLALAIARDVARLCQAQLHTRVFLTRDGDRDMELSDRVDFANRKRARLFVSIHLNAMPNTDDGELRRSARGVETYFLSADPSDASASAQAQRENLDQLTQRSAGKRRDVDVILNDLALTEAQADSSRLAYAIHQRLVGTTHAVDRGVHQAPFYVLTGAHMPAILVEVGFISHQAEEERLVTRGYQRLVAQAIVDGIRDYEQTVAPRMVESAGDAAPAQ